MISVGLKGGSDSVSGAYSGYVSASS